MQDLVDDGYVVKIQGKGTFVAQRQVKRTGLLLTGFTEDMKALGKRPTSSLLALHMAVPPAWASQALGLAPFESAVFLARLRLVDNEPLAIHRIWLAPRLGIDLEELRSITSLYSFLREEKGIALVQAEESIQAIAAAPEAADLLHIEPGAPVLFVKRMTYDLQGETVETGECLYRGDLYEHYLFTRQGH
jgi:GntR family transcriptional regulator